MTIHRRSSAAVVFSLAVALVLFVSSAPQRATAVTANAQNLSYVIAYEPMFGFGVPFLGWFQGRVNNGIISGTYRGLSITGNDPFTNRTTAVTGGVTGNNLHFSFGTGSNRLSFNGQLASDNTLQGTATWRGRLFRLAGQPGRPRGM